jgi:acid stress chaperone HdeB
VALARRRAPVETMLVKTPAAAFAFVLVAAFAVSPACAQVHDMSTFKCKAYIESSKETANLILMWLDGYFTDEEDPTVVDFGKMKEAAEKLTTYCAQHPNMALMTAAENVMEK